MSADSPNVSIKFTDEGAYDLWCDDVDGWVEVIGSERIIHHSRWSVTVERIFKSTGKDERFYRVVYERGATEYQEDGGVVEHVEVKPVRKVVTVYE